MVVDERLDALRCPLLNVNGVLMGLSFRCENKIGDPTRAKEEFGLTGRDGLEGLNAGEGGIGRSILLNPDPVDDVERFD